MSRGALCVCLLTLWTLLQGTAGVLSELYFSNNNDIMRLTNGSSTVVIPGLKLVDTIECNICDRMIYWVDQNPPVAIRRALPGNASSVETILDRDLDHPKGLAVDWVGNNIYFSHGNRIEVATCDGQHRRVLKVIENVEVGPIAIDLTTGYLYYVADMFFVHRMMLNGSSDDGFMQVVDSPEIVGMEIDVVNQVLYWTNKGDSTPSHAIKRLDLTTVVRQVDTIVTQSIAYKLVIHGNTLYWTELNQVDHTTSEIDRPGALYSMELGSGDMEEEVLLRNYTLSPQDLCYFFEMSMSENSCAVNNGGCDVLCLTVPSIGGGTEPQCACPTGILFSPDGDTCLPYPNEFLLFTQRHDSDASSEVSHTDVRLISLDAPPFFVDTPTSVTVPDASARFIAYDVVTLFVYWSQVDPPQIRRAPVHGTEGEEEVVIQTSISLPESLAIDAYAMNLYWVDSALDKIEVVGIGETNRYRKVLVQTGRKPQGLALDLLNRFMYWTDLDKSAPRVERCHMDGTNCTQILTHLPPNTIREPATITVDPLSSWVYFAETQSDRVFRYNGLTGEHTDEQLRDPESGTAPDDVAGLAVHGNYLYWTDRSGNGASMARVDKVEFTASEIVHNSGGLHGLLAVDHSASAPSPMCSLCDQLCLSPSCACADHFILDTSTQGSCLEPPATLLMGSTLGVFQFTENSASVNWNGNNEPILNINVDHMDVDFSTDTLFWVSKDDKLVYRNSLKNTSLPAERVVHCCVGEISDLAVDWFGRNLYWVDSARHVIEVAQLDGRHRIVLYNVPPSLGTLNIITLDPLRGHLYWSPDSGAKIYRWRMDGSSTMSPDVFWESPDYTEVFGLALNYTANAGISDQLYFGVYSNDPPEWLVYSLEVDDEDNLSRQGQFNSAVKDLSTYKGDSYVIHGDTLPTVVKVQHDDSTNNHNEVAIPIALFNQPLSTLSLAINHHSLQPGLHECSVDNRGCGGGAVCLVETGVRGACVCPPLEASANETDSIGINHITCAAEDTFVLLATEDGVYVLPYVPPSLEKSTSKVQLLPLPPVGSIQSLTYDPINKSILFTDDTSQLHSVSLDSSSDYSYSLVNDSAPYSMAYDWRGGHVFTTTSPGFQIELTTINGEGVGSVLEFQATEKRYVLNILGELLFDTDRQRLYWTYVAHNKELGMVAGAELRYMDMSDSTSTERSVDLGGRSIRNITLEPESGSIYWVSIVNTRFVIIERFFPNNGTIVSVHSAAPASVTGLAVTMVNGQLLLFWYDSVEEAIFLHNGSKAVIYRGWSSGGARIVGMLAHTTMPVPVNLPCLVAERPCSHYCLSDSHTSALQCSCPSNTQLENGVTCSDVPCGNSLWSCGGDSPECYPRTYLCDDIPHCRNGADETCNCSQGDFGCYLSDTGDECVAMELKCDGIRHCSNGEDEMDCCETNQFGCYVEDDTYKPLGGGSVIRYHCLYNSSRCDGMVDCLNQTIDEPLDCPTTMTPEPITTPTSIATLLSTPIIITSVVISFFIAVIGLFFCCYCCRQFYKKKQAEITSSRMSRAFNFNLATYKQAESPQPRVDSVSDYYSDISRNTNTTQIGSHISHGSMYKQQHQPMATDPTNPPPSPMTLAHSYNALTDIEDDISVFSQTMSEYPIPPVPNPSLNYDLVSDNLSYSVSQSHYPATISGRAPNPLLLGQQPNHPYYHNGGYHYPQQQVANQWAPKRGQDQPNQGKQYPPSDYHHYPPSHPRKELDSLARTETESTISMTTVSTENQDEYLYDEEGTCMSYAPPGRPPSPVTVVSDYHPPAPPMSPDSTLSEISDEDCSERQLHQT